MKRPRQKVKTVAVTYRNGEQVIEYVSRRPSDLIHEYRRIRQAILDANVIINKYPVRRVRHVLLDICRFQLANSLRDIDDSATPVELAGEVARLSFLMSEALVGINRLRHSRVAFLEELRFKLTYGQSPRKRDVDNKILNKDDDDDDTDGES